MGKKPLDLKEQWERAAFPPAGWSGDLYFTSPQGNTLRYSTAPAAGESRGQMIIVTGYGQTESNTDSRGKECRAQASGPDSHYHCSLFTERRWPLFLLLTGR